MYAIRSYYDTDGDGIADAADGVINSDDRTFQGVSIPKINYGLNINLGYKNWDFSVFAQGAAGHKVFNGTYRVLMLGDYVNHHDVITSYSIHYTKLYELSMIKVPFPILFPYLPINAP